MLFGDDGGTPRCSSRDCFSEPSSTVVWRNPRIHGTDRVKEWAACELHAETLHSWLTSRGFPAAIVPFGTSVSTVEEAMSE